MLLLSPICSLLFVVYFLQHSCRSMVDPLSESSSLFLPLSVDRRETQEVDCIIWGSLTWQNQPFNEIRCAVLRRAVSFQGRIKGEMCTFFLSRIWLSRPDVGFCNCNWTSYFIPGKSICGAVLKAYLRHWLSTESELMPTVFGFFK